MPHWNESIPTGLSKHHGLHIAELQMIICVLLNQVQYAVMPKHENQLELCGEK